jgi:hypothetical protein
MLFAIPDPEHDVAVRVVVPRDAVEPHKSALVVEIGKWSLSRWSWNKRIHSDFFQGFCFLGEGKGQKEESQVLH